MRLAAVTLYGGLFGFVFFSVNFDVFHEADLVDFCEDGAWSEGNSVDWIPSMCRELCAAEWSKPLGFKVVHNCFFADLYESFYYGECLFCGYCEGVKLDVFFKADFLEVGEVGYVLEHNLNLLRDVFYMKAVPQLVLRASSDLCCRECKLVEVLCYL